MAGLVKNKNKNSKSFLSSNDTETAAVRKITVSNSFTAGQIVFNNGTWTLAKADNPNTYGTHLVIEATSDYFIIASGGIIDTTGISLGSPTVGDILYVSESTAGLVQNNTANQKKSSLIKNPIGVVVDTNRVLLIPYLGAKIYPEDYYIASETIAVAKIVAINSSGETVVATKNNSAKVNVVGVAVTAGTASNPMYVARNGSTLGIFSGLTAGLACYLGDTGAVTQTLTYTPGEYRVFIGVAKSATEIHIMIEDAILVTQSSQRINYITNGIFDRATTGWVTYADAAQATPVNGTGGSPTTTFARNTTTPLRGEGDGVITVDAANRQGEGISYDFTLPNSQVETNQEIEIWTKGGTNGGSYVDGNYGVYIYDVTNSILIATSAINISSSTGRFYATWTPNPTSTSYRLILHNQSTQATGFKLFIDDVRIGPQQTAIGAGIGKWKLYPDGTYVFPSGNQSITGGLLPIGAVTTAPTKATVKIKDSAYFRENGETLDLDLIYRHDSATGTGAGSGNYVIALPLGFTWHSRTVFNTSATPKTGWIVGTICSGTNEFPLAIDPYDTTTFRLLQFDGVNSDHLYVGSANKPITAAPWEISIKISIPVSELVGRNTVNLATSDTPIYLSNNTATNANDSTDANTYTGAYGSAVPPVATSAKTKRVVHRALMPNEIPVLQFRHATAGTWIDASELSILFSGDYYGVINTSRSYDATNHAGCGILPVDSTHTDVVFNINAVYEITTGAMTWTTFASTYDRYRIKISPQNPVELTLPIYAAYKRTSSFTSGTLNFNTLVKDDYALVTTGASWKFTAPRRGIAHVTVMRRNISGAACSGEWYLNGSMYRIAHAIGTAVSTIKDSVTWIINLEKNDYIHYNATNGGDADSDGAFIEIMLI